MYHESDGDINCNWHTPYSNQRIGTGIGGLGNKRTCRDHPNVIIIVFGQNTESYPGDFRRLAVTQTPVRNHQLTLLGKLS